jgi:hypothetical protein
MSKSNSLEEAILDSVLNNNDTDLDTHKAATLYLALCTADPGEAATGASMSEIAYTSYARVAVTSSSGWTTSGATRTNTGAITWPACTGGSGTATHWALVDSSSGAGDVLYKGALTASLAISSGITPTAAIGAISIGED